MFPRPSSVSRVLMCLSIKFTNILSATPSTITRFQLLSYISRSLKFYLPYQCFITMPFFSLFQLSKIAARFLVITPRIMLCTLQSSYRFSVDRIFGTFGASTRTPPSTQAVIPGARNGSLMSFISPHMVLRSYRVQICIEWSRAVYPRPPIDSNISSSSESNILPWSD